MIEWMEFSYDMEFRVFSGGGVLLLMFEIRESNWSRWIGLV